MSKETLTAEDCMGCGQRFQFLKYHEPHCKPLADKLKAKGLVKLAPGLEAMAQGMADAAMRLGKIGDRDAAVQIARAVITGAPLRDEKISKGKGGKRR